MEILVIFMISRSRLIASCPSRRVVRHVAQRVLESCLQQYLMIRYEKGTVYNNIEMIVKSRQEMPPG